MVKFRVKRAWIGGVFAVVVARSVEEAAALAPVYCDGLSEDGPEDFIVVAPSGEAFLVGLSAKEKVRFVVPTATPLPLEVEQ